MAGAGQSGARHSRWGPGSMNNVNEELKKFELRSAAAVWDSLTPSQQMLLITEPRTERQYGGGASLAETDKIIGERSWHWPDGAPEYHDNEDAARLLGLGLVSVWQGLSSIGFYRLTGFGEIVARYGRAAHCMALAREEAA